MHILPDRTKCELLRNSRNFSTIYFSLKYAGIDILHCTFIRLYVHLGRRHYTSRAKCTIFPYAAKLHTFKLDGCMYVRSVTKWKKRGSTKWPWRESVTSKKKILIAWQIFLCKISRQGGGRGHDSHFLSLGIDLYVAQYTFDLLIIRHCTGNVQRFASAATLYVCVCAV